ncbi:hypothetical protein BH09ACT8_BH09ACT8_08410 [soil metagenome]
MTIFAGAQRNLLLQPSSTRRHPSADATDWTGTWVCVGLAGQLAEVGAVLPATIGVHAAHVRRTDDGLMAAINARPFGGCVSIPVHCGSTQNVKCPQLACAFSEDGGVLDSTTDPTGAARLGFVGDGRRTVRLPLAQWGPLLFVNVTMSDPPPLAIPDPTSLAEDRVVATGRRPMSGNWLDTPIRAAAAIADFLGGADIDANAPAANLALVRTASDTVAVLSRPAGRARSTVVWAVIASRNGALTERPSPETLSNPDLSRILPV